jgi:hypothetical protein
MVFTNSFVLVQEGLKIVFKNQELKFLNVYEETIQKVGIT